jgi:putative ABC transport system permease protein
MTLFGLATRQIRAHRLRNTLTILAVAVAVLAFVVMRTFAWSWTVGASVASKDRIITRHKVTFFHPMPRRYAAEVRDVEGVAATTYALWTDSKSPAHEGEYFPALAVDATTFPLVFDEMSVPADQHEAWMNNRQGAVVGKALATKLGWKPGDRVQLVSGKFPEPGEWEFTIEGVYDTTRRSLEQSWFLFHYDYFNATLPPAEQDQANWITSRIENAGEAANVSAAIDARFDVRDTQTLTMTQSAAQTSFLGVVSAVLSTVNIVSGAILLIMMMILGNTIAMGVRARTGQYAVLRAIGFRPHHLLLTILAEGIVIGALGGVLGLAVAYPFVNQALGPFIELNMGNYFPYFQVTPQLAAVAFGLAVGLAALAALLPAISASRLNVISALRKVD